MINLNPFQPINLTPLDLPAIPSTSDQEKISVQSPAPNISKKTKTLKYDPAISSIYYSEYSHRIYKGVSLLLQTENENNSRSTWGVFNCCGARTLSKFTTDDLTEREKQEFVAEFLRTKTEYHSWYFLLASYQLKNNSYPLVDLFLDLGAKEIDSRPNRYHGPEHMHLMVWSPLDCADQISKYAKKDVHTSRSAGFDAKYYDWEPLWWSELDDSERRAYLDCAVTQANRKARYRESKNSQAQKQQTILNQAIQILYYNATERASFLEKLPK